MTFLSGEALGKEIPLLRAQVTFGRGPECDCLVADPTVSRMHMRLTCRKVVGRSGTPALRVVLSDLDSANGTLVNYRRVTRAVLRSGDKLHLGRIILKFEYKDLADQDFFDAIYRMATTDELTGLLNKATITRVLKDAAMLRERYAGRLSAILLAIDDFKSLNDTYGHLAGDRALQEVARTLQRYLRRQDRAGRFGGGKFLIVLPETGTRGARASAERIRAEIETTLAGKVNVPCRLTSSLGIASCPPREERQADFEGILERADAALHRAKATGRNRVECWRKSIQAASGRQS